MAKTAECQRLGRGRYVPGEETLQFEQFQQRDLRKSTLALYSRFQFCSLTLLVEVMEPLCVSDSDLPPAAVLRGDR